jgi:8-amino-7-oxononanoate synthase
MHTGSRAVKWTAWADAQLDALRAAHRWRCTKTLEAPLVSFASNDYLGLSVHPSVRAAAMEALERYGLGAGASRLVAGTHAIHFELDNAIAAWQHCERALVFPSGYAANLAALSALGTADVAIFSDELNHASIIDGCRLSKAKTHIYRHCNLNHLEDLLRSTNARKLVVSDTVFSMDGDIAPLNELSTLCAQHDALLVLDEAHAALQPAGQQLPCEVLRVGTLSKALGSQGGWIAGSQALIELLTNTARSFIYTTGLSLPDAAGALAALQIYTSREGDELREALRLNVDYLQPAHPSPIVPLIFGAEAEALAASDHLREHGVFCPAIRPPTVPHGTSRLRITLSASHGEEDMMRLLQALTSLPCKPIGLQH